MSGMHRAAWPALGAAVLFGASTPFAKQLIGDDFSASSPFQLAGLLYLGSGIGLTSIRLMRDRGWKAVELPSREWPWLLAAIAFGGVLGPLLLMVGLSHTTAATASLFLNLESVLTAVLAWVVFRENADRRIVLGMALIVAGGSVLAWPVGNVSEAAANASGWGTLALALACLAWAIDNNLTRKVSLHDATWIASVKGLCAGTVNLLLALAIGSGAWPKAPAIAGALVLGFFAYGVSLALFVVALRHLGTARTGAYFSIAPFFGALLAVVGLGEPMSARLLLAAGLMAVGVWLHLSERHLHEHTHEPIEHEHAHEHDMHHAHAHPGAGWAARHTHRHRHEALTHAHAHFPDELHRHRH